MPCLAIHLAVAKKYLEKHPYENKDEFILGTIAPDIDLPNINDYIKGVSSDKNSHHFGLNFKVDNMIEYMKKKVDFKLFFASNDINTSFLRAYFLHLLCDFYFFGEYITDEMLKNLPFDEAAKIGYNDYDLITPILIRKYDLVFPKEVEHFAKREGHGEIQILKEDTVDTFIEEMSNINLEEQKEIVTK